jgi:photosystem II stability/assembly factor-like uncharacterized protein
MCRVSCEPGWRPTPAGTACEACDDLNSCGLECAACPPDPPGAAYGCTSNTVAAAQACALACDAGFVKVGAACLSNGWVPWSLGTSAHLSAVAFADALSGLIAGNGVLFRTADGGKGWTGSSVSALVPALAYPAPAAAFLSTGAASGGARVLRSVNGGATWSASLSGTGFAITHLAFASASVGWAAGATSGVPPAPVLYATANGGASWTPLAAPSANVPLALHRVIARGVWGDAGGIYASDNGGTSWTGPALLQGPGGTVREPRGLSMHDGLLGWATTHCSTHKTIDGAASFSGEDLLCEAIDFAALAFPTADDGWIVGGQDEQSVSAGVIFVTGDAGGCWEPQVGNVAQNHLRAVHMIDAVRGWSVGDSGTVLYTNSGGDCIGAGCARQCP